MHPRGKKIKKVLWAKTICIFIGMKMGQQRLATIVDFDYHLINYLHYQKKRNTPFRRRGGGKKKGEKMKKILESKNYLSTWEWWGTFSKRETRHLQLYFWLRCVQRELWNKGKRIHMIPFNMSISDTHDISYYHHLQKPSYGVLNNVENFR